MEVNRSIRPIKLLTEGHCDEHNTYKGMRCMDCELWICGMCGMLNHRQCRTLLVKAAYEEIQEQIALSLEKELEERNARTDKINDSLKVLDVKREELIEELKNCEKKIEELESLKLKEENLCENVNLVKQISESSSTYEEFSNAKRDIDSLREIGKQHNSIELQGNPLVCNTSSASEDSASIILADEIVNEEDDSLEVSVDSEFRPRSIQIKLEDTESEEPMKIEVQYCHSSNMEPTPREISEICEIVQFVNNNERRVISTGFGDDLNKANQNEIMPTNSSDVEMAEPEVDKRKRPSCEGLDSVTNSPVKSKKPYRQPLVEPIQNSLNTPNYYNEDITKLQQPKTIQAVQAVPIGNVVPDMDFEIHDQSLPTDEHSNSSLSRSTDDKWTTILNTISEFSRRQCILVEQNIEILKEMEVMKRSTGKSHSELSPEDDFSKLLLRFPIATREDFSEANHTLKTCDKIRVKFVKWLAQKGGSDRDEVANICMNLLFSNNFSNCFNWSGHTAINSKEKVKVPKLQLKNSEFVHVIHSVAMMKGFRTGKLIDFSIKKWITKAYDRRSHMRKSNKLRTQAEN